MTLLLLSLKETMEPRRCYLRSQLYQSTLLTRSSTLDILFLKLPCKIWELIYDKFFGGPAKLDWTSESVGILQNGTIGMSRRIWMTLSLAYLSMTNEECSPTSRLINTSGLSDVLGEWRA